MNKTEFDTAVAAARAEAVAEWRARAIAIVDSPAGMRAPKAANLLVMTDTPVGEAIKQLEAMPAETPEALAAEAAKAGWAKAVASANARHPAALSPTDDEPFRTAVSGLALSPAPRFVCPEDRAKAGWAAAVSAANERNAGLGGGAPLRPVGAR